MKILGSYQKNIIRKIQTLIDIAPHEWFRVWYLFLITFFFMVGHVFGHAIILASVTTTMGIYALPYFLIIAAVFAMVGTTVFARIIAKYDKPKLFVGLSLAAVVTLVAAYIVGDSHLYLFYSLVLLVVSVFQVQLHTILALMKEHKFSPLESQRTFPVIESSELLAGIVGGGVISLFIGHGFFAHYIHLSVNDFLLFWAGALLLAVITHYVFLFFEKRQPVLVAAHEENENLMHFTDSLQQAYKYFSENKFLRNIAFFVFLQFAVFQAFEFLYTFYLSSHDDSHGESILHGLGYYVFITSIIGIFLQVFVSSFISKKLGVVKNLLLHPFLTLPVGFLMQFQFSQGSVIGAKGMFDVTKQIAKNAYMSSLYAIPDNIRQLAKPFLDGFVAQLGIIFSTGFLILFELFLHDHVTLAASIFINILLFTMIIVLFYFREIYTGQVTMNLKNFSYSEEERFSFIEILGQK
ncbi:MAG: hypothetical protein U9Q15_04435 [Patescibacteria group bacterium]|nr:hypothetical protein [Patescibacteria group bacterium]